MANASTKINIGTGFSAHVDYEDLEDLGWEFGHLYEGVAAAKEMSLEEAEEWEKENYHVRLYWDEYQECVMWIPSHNTDGDTGDAEDPGDQEMTHDDIQSLWADGLLWGVSQSGE